MLSARAPAKINLTLHVHGRRADGYHALESLVAFAGTGDALSLAPGPSLALSLKGPTAPLAGAGRDNLVLKATRLLAERVEGLRVGAFTLVKRLPVAAGLGGGSSDAAAALRLLARLNGLPLSDHRIREAARLAGADVPACLEPRARMMRGAGEAVGPPIALPRLFGVLVNPGIPVSTPAVFEALGLKPGENLTASAHPILDGVGDLARLLRILRTARNDLELPAVSLTPQIGDALRRLAGTHGCRLARMSGSGATVFGLFQTCEGAASAAKALRADHPRWWIKSTILR
jgi:4-diphosphocytidyl-2-C-methyl-D-erythritol kinase